MIHLDYGNLGEEEAEAAIGAILSGQVSTAGKAVPHFESAMAECLGVDASRVIAVNSGTSALHIALICAGVGRGDEVIIPASTFVATANAVSYVGAIPVLVDVDSNTWNIDLSQIQGEITPKTKAIIPVHMLGNPVDMDRVMHIARENGLQVIEDAAQALGSRFFGDTVGITGDYGCFSFNGNKTMTTSAGGLLVVPSGKDKLARAWISPKESLYPAYNYRMTGLAASVGMAQLLKLDKFLDKKRRLFSIYQQEFGGILKLQLMQPGAVPWMTAAIIPEIKELPFPTRPFYPVINSFPPYKSNEVFPVASMLAESCIMLPSSTLNGPEEIEKVCGILKAKLS